MNMATCCPTTVGSDRNQYGQHPATRLISQLQLGGSLPAVRLCMPWHGLSEDRLKLILLTSLSELHCDPPPPAILYVSNFWDTCICIYALVQRRFVSDKAHPRRGHGCVHGSYQALMSGLADTALIPAVAVTGCCRLALKKSSERCRNSFQQYQNTFNDVQTLVSLRQGRQ